MKKRNVFELILFIILLIGCFLFVLLKVNSYKNSSTIITNYTTFYTSMFIFVLLIISSYALFISSLNKCLDKKMKAFNINLFITVLLFTLEIGIFITSFYGLLNIDPEKLYLLALLFSIFNISYQFIFLLIEKIISSKKESN